MKGNFIKILFFGLIVLISACSGGKAQTTPSVEKNAFEERGSFSADSAYSYVARQVEFGPRVPGTQAHTSCSEWLVEQFTAFGADTVFIMGNQATLWDGSVMPVRNIVARYKGEKPILLAAHYDTRPWADQDPDAEARNQPFDGANDGASGVGVLLEIARNLGATRPEVGVDILLTDLEDYGSNGKDDSWCIGSQQFADALLARNPNLPLSGYQYGILLDMVGGKDARFPREYLSVQYAPAPTAKIWDMAAKLGLRNRFPTSVGGAITDDHLPLIRAGVPTADVIESVNPQTGTFPSTWHTKADNLENIDRATLGDVGRVVLNVIYNEK